MWLAILLPWTVPLEARDRIAGGFVASVHPMATDAGLEALRRGGNAVDAAVACALALGVVDAHNSGLGGGCFILLHAPDGTLRAIDGREKAPALASRDLFLHEGEVVPEWSQEGPLAVGTPGALAALARAHHLHGQLPWAELCLAAANLAEQGYPLESQHVGIRDRIFRELETRYPSPTPGNFATVPTPRIPGQFPTAVHFQGFRSLWHPVPGPPPGVGEIFSLPDLARTLRSIGIHGPEWFYRGPFAREVGRWMQAHGGLLTEADFIAYRPVEREPVRGWYRGHEIISFPPPSSGGVHLLQMLHLLERFDLAAMGDDSPEFVHRVTEAMRLAFADRAHWLGDPDHVGVPRGLLDPDYLAGLAARIEPDRVADIPGHGTPPHPDTDVFPGGERRHTTHLCAADAEGFWVTLTATVNTSHGSKVVVPGTGVVLNNEMDDFTARPGTPNFFGLLGAEANAVAPGKRPLSSMTPTLVLKDGRPVLAVGGAGGPTIISQTLLAVLRWIDFGLDPQEALRRPRFHHQWRPDVLRVEQRDGQGLPTSTLTRLQVLGHRIEPTSGLGVVQMIALDRTSPAFQGAHDPKVQGRAAAP